MNHFVKSMLFNPIDEIFASWGKHVTKYKNFQLYQERCLRNSQILIFNRLINDTL